MLWHDAADICFPPPLPIFCVGAPPPPNFAQSAAEGSPNKWYMIRIVSFFLLLYLIAVYLIDYKLQQVATKWRSLNSYMFTLCSAYHVT
jgi:hypothetical protein